MDLVPPARARRLRYATRAILAAGFGAALVVFFAASERPQDPLGDSLGNKKYIHDLELYGGKANVLAAQFREWFAGLWYGRNLAYTIAILTVLLVLAVRFFAIPPTPMTEEDPEEPPEEIRGPRRVGRG